MLDDVQLADRPLARSKTAKWDFHSGGWSVWAAPLAALALAGLEHAHLLAAETAPVALVAALLLVGSVFAAVHHAEVVAHKVGEPFGSIVLGAGGHRDRNLADCLIAAVGLRRENSLAASGFSIRPYRPGRRRRFIVVVGAVRYREQRSASKASVLR